MRTYSDPTGVEVRVICEHCGSFVETAGMISHQQTTNCQAHKKEKRLWLEGYGRCSPYSGILRNAGIPLEKVTVAKVKGLPKRASRFWAPLWAVTTCIYVGSEGRGRETVRVLRGLLDANMDEALHVAFQTLGSDVGGTMVVGAIKDLGLL